MRKLAIGAWGSPSDPSTNVQFDIDITKLDKTHLKPHLIKILSKILNEHSDINRILIRRKFRKRLDNRIFIPTVIRNKKFYDLSGIHIDDAYKYKLNELQEIWNEKINALRSGKNKEIKRVIKIYKLLPRFLVKIVTKMLSFIHYSCNIPISIFGLPNDPFGPITVTFLDKFNVRYANVPIYAFSRATMTVSVGKNYIENNRTLLPLSCTFDHRYFDGMEGYKALKKIRYYCSNPEKI